MNAESPFSTWEEAVAWLRAQPDQDALVRAAYYDDPLVGAADRYHRSEEWQEIRRYLPASRGRALDAGAGRGIASYALAREGFDVVAIEPDPSSLVGARAIHALAADTGLPITVIQEYSERLPFADAAFDAVFARAALHHTRNLQLACSEFFRVLKPGGRFIAVREHVISRKSDMPAFLDAHPLHRIYGGENAFLLREYLDAMKCAGFSAISVLAPLASPINYAPHTKDSLREEMIQRLGKIPGSQRVLRCLLGPGWAFAVLLGALSLVDSRPGRLYSFIASKPVLH